MEENKPMYGIWIPGKGWLRCKPNEPNGQFADYNIEKARQVARNIGMGARVMYIDEGIIELERDYLEREGRTLWRYFRNFLKLKG